MKLNKLLSVFAVSSLAMASLSAFDAKAKVTMEGSLFRETKESGEDAKYELFALDAIESHNKNKVEIDVDAGPAGAHFELFYMLQGGSKAEDGWVANARNTYIWFKPVDQVQLRLGYVGIKDFFVERIDEEKVGNPFKYKERLNYVEDPDTGVPYYITNADVDEMGFGLGISPIENLTFTGAIAPGISGTNDNADSPRRAGILKDGENGTTYAPWGLTACYAMDSLKFQLAYRDNGKQSWKVIRMGAGYETDEIYAFVQPIFGIDYITSKDKYELNGTCIDLYGEYKMDALKFTGHLPVTFRTTGKKDDPKYLEFLAKVEYNTGMHGLLDDVTPYFLARNMDHTVVTLDDSASDNFALTLQGGTAFKVADAKIDVGLRIDIHNKLGTSERVTWSVPFTAKIEF